MKKLLSLTLLLLLVGCSKSIEILDARGQRTIEVQKIHSTATQLLSFKELRVQESGTEPCTHSGYCVTCGFGFKGQTCGFGFYFNCPGTKSVIFIKGLETYRKIYKTNRGEYESPVYERKTKRYTFEGVCQ